MMENIGQGDNHNAPVLFGVISAMGDLDAPSRSTERNSTAS